MVESTRAETGMSRPVVYFDEAAPMPCGGQASGRSCRKRDAGSLLDGALLQSLGWLPSEPNRPQRVREIIRRSA